MTTNQTTPEPTERREVTTAKWLLVAELRKLINSGENWTIDQMGERLAQGLDRAGLITRSE